MSTKTTARDDLAPPCEADYGSYFLIRDGQEWPEDLAHVGFVGVANFRDAGLRTFYRCTDRQGHNRKERRTSFRWRQQISAAENRNQCEGRQTSAWLHIQANENMDMDDLLAAAGGQ